MTCQSCSNITNVTVIIGYVVKTDVKAQLNTILPILFHITDVI